jgi:hypothetical protein
MERGSTPGGSPLDPGADLPEHRRGQPSAVHGGVCKRGRILHYG